MDKNDRFDELESLSNWELVHDEQDIRGRDVQSETGESYGTVEDLMVDKDKEHVAAVKLSDGRLVPASHLEITDSRVIYREDSAASRPDYSRVKRPAAT
ncbi:MAG: PRC-barrel domain-containing protein [Henriciella sp.]|uniref:PRC-barrel domain-containing protein n=1 Tax=Henriciella sp. TaxID=1968823 RepID=UPI003C742E62